MIDDNSRGRPRKNPQVLLEGGTMDMGRQAEDDPGSTTTPKSSMLAISAAGSSNQPCGYRPLADKGQALNGDPSRPSHTLPPSSQAVSSGSSNGSHPAVQGHKTMDQSPSSVQFTVSPLYQPQASATLSATAALPTLTLTLSSSASCVEPVDESPVCGVDEDYDS